MKNSLQKLIREAFNTAYDTHKTVKKISILKESAEELGALLQPDKKAEADQVINTMAAQKPGWEKYQWDPSGGFLGLSQKQWNYIAEKLFELYHATHDEKYKKILGNFFTFARKTTGTGAESQTTNSALYNSIIGSLLADTALERIYRTDPDFFYEALSRVWGRVFAGGKTDPKGKMVKAIDPETGKEIINPKTGKVQMKLDRTLGKFAGQKNVDLWEKIVDDYIPRPGSNFGAYLREFIFKDVKDLIKSEIQNGTISLDKPNKTGKASEFGDDSEEGIEDIRQGEEFGDEENIEGADEPTQGYENITTDADYERQKNAAVKVKKFQKAISDIVHASKTLGIKNETGLLALKEIGLNFLNYEEIVNKYPDLFKEKEAGEGNAIRSILKNKHLVSISNEVLSKYNLSYDIFADSDWETKYNIGPEVVEEIISKFSNATKADATLKKKYINVFREYAINHLSPDKIANKYSGIVKKQGAADTLVKAALYNLGKNNRFVALADSILRENGFNIDFESINWSDFAKAGKAMMDVERAKEPVADASDASDDAKDKYVWETFLAENLDKVMERVYKRLEKRL